MVSLSLHLAVEEQQHLIPGWADQCARIQPLFHRLLPELALKEWAELVTDALNHPHLKPAYLP